MKLRKENGLPNALLKYAEPAKKRSKLVLPEPQVSDQDMQQVIKLGKASENARDVVLESGIETTHDLLGDYSINTQIVATPRTPAVISDRIMQEAQTIMALTHVETPLKGGINTLLHETDFSNVLPTPKLTTTSNTLLITPYNSMSNADSSATPVLNASNFRYDKDNNYTPSLARDKLNINIDEYSAETPIVNKEFRKQARDSLREKLSNLPLPRNDYEIVVPEESMENSKINQSSQLIEDQADIDMRIREEIRLTEAAEMSRRSQVIQKKLPRPYEINTTILRPLTDMVGLSELQRAEELIKQEMITMLHFDAISNPVVSFAINKKSFSSQQLQSYLEQNPYDEFDEVDLKKAKDLLKTEMTVVKQGMAHGDLSLENYSQVWQECLGQVLYLPSQNRYTRANLASKKDRFEAAERKLEQNRKHMAKEAKRCGKIEKKLKILTGGYQARAQAVIKQLNETWDQIDQNTLALSTFNFLADKESSAIPRRTEVFYLYQF